MRRAPPVAVDCDRGAGWRWGQTLLFALSAASLAAWAGAHADLPGPGRIGVVLLASAVAGAIAFRALEARPVRLAWDGERWTVGPSAEPGQVDVMIDLGAWLLLRFRFDAPGAASRWLSLSAGAAGGSLHALRAAAYSAPANATDRIRSPERQPD